MIYSKAKVAGNAKSFSSLLAKRRESFLFIGDREIISLDSHAKMKTKE